MLPSTLSGYTKCSNFTPVWRRTDGVSAPCTIWARLARRRVGPVSFWASEFKDHNSMNHWGEMKKITWWKSVHFGVLCLNLSFLQTKKLKPDGPNRIHPPHFVKEDTQVFLQPKFPANGWYPKYILTYSEFLKPTNRKKKKKRRHLWLSVISWNLLERRLQTLCRWLNWWLGFLIFLICWARWQNVSFYHQHKWWWFYKIYTC